MHQRVRAQWNTNSLCSPYDVTAHWWDNLNTVVAWLRWVIFKNTNKVELPMLTLLNPTASLTMYFIWQKIFIFCKVKHYQKPLWLYMSYVTLRPVSLYNGGGISFIIKSIDCRYITNIWSYIMATHIFL